MVLVLMRQFLCVDVTQSRRLRIRSRQNPSCTSADLFAGEIPHPDRVWRDTAPLGSLGFELRDTGEVARVSGHEHCFERVGSIPRSEMGLPASRARELQLAQAWREIAGEAVARRAPALRVRRGVLEVEVREELWRRTLRDVLPGLAGRLAARHPDLRIVRYRMISGVADTPEPAHPVALDPEIPERPRVKAAAAVLPKEERQPGPGADIREVMERYLARGGRRRRATQSP